MIILSRKLNATKLVILDTVEFKLPIANRISRMCFINFIKLRKFLKTTKLFYINKIKYHTCMASFKDMDFSSRRVLISLT